MSGCIECGAAPRLEGRRICKACFNARKLAYARSEHGRAVNKAYASSRAGKMAAFRHRQKKIQEKRQNDKKNETN